MLKITEIRNKIKTSKKYIKVHSREQTTDH